MVVLTIGAGYMIVSYGIKEGRGALPEAQRTRLLDR
jgi:hypothetical protein